MALIQYQVVFVYIAYPQTLALQMVVIDKRSILNQMT